MRCRVFARPDGASPWRLFTPQTSSFTLPAGLRPGFLPITNNQKPLTALWPQKGAEDAKKPTTNNQPPITITLPQIDTDEHR
jgi:hypothetical protein